MKLTIILTMFLASILVGCDRNTEYGECVGVLTLSQKNPRLQYEFDKSNIFVALILSETIIVPVYVAAYIVECPVGFASSPSK